MNGNPLKIDPGDITELLDAVKSDKEARKVFLAMQREDQLLSILGLIAYLSQQIALNGKNFEEFKKEVRRRAESRELVERQLGKKLNVNLATAEADDDPDMSTTQKVQAVIKAQYGGYISFAVDFFKDILKLVLTAMFLYLIYATFGGTPP